MAGLDRRGAFQLPAVGHVQLQPDQVGAGGDLGDRVLDLQPGVDLEEREQLLAGVVEELDGAGAAVADGHGEPLGRRLQLRGLLRFQDRGGGLLDDLLVAPLHRAVADAQRPGGALPVGDDLDLDVPGAGDQAFQEHHAGAECAQRLLAGALVGVGQVLVRGDHPDATPASARGRLEHQRVADLVAGAQRVGQGGDLAAAPRRDRDADLLGDQLRADLVAELAHRLRARPDEGDTDLLAQLGERRVLGDEPPADPGGVGPGLHQRALQDGVVEVRAGRGGAERVGDVSFTDEGRGAVGVGVEGDRLDSRPGFRRKIPDSVDEPHRGLSTVDDCDTTEHRLSLPSTHTHKATSGSRSVACTRLYPARLPPGTPMSRFAHAGAAVLLRNPTKAIGPHAPAAVPLKDLPDKTRPHPTDDGRPYFRRLRSATVVAFCVAGYRLIMGTNGALRRVLSRVPHRPGIWPATCRVARLSRFHRLTVAIDRTSLASSFSS